VRALDYSDLKNLGVVIKRAQYFITCKGKYNGNVLFKDSNIRQRLTPKNDLNLRENLKNNIEQLSFLDNSSKLLIKSAAITSLNGEF